MYDSAQKPTRRVLMIPANAPKISGRPLFFLFTLSQIEDIIREARVWTVPFTPSHVQGLCLWREQVMPVICLEAYLGIETHSCESSRMLVVRSPERKVRGMLNTSAGIRLMPEPQFYAFTESLPWNGRRELIRGIYEWAEGWIVIVHMDRILAGEYPEQRKTP
jgi:chemotaxis signal transduction protein